MSPKNAAVAILIATMGATLTITPAQASEDAMPAPVVQTINKYELSSFQAPTFETPKVVSWAVAYTPNTSNKTQLDPAEKALLADDAELAQKQKTVVEQNAAIVRTELKRIAAEKAALEKAAAEKAAAEKAAADKLAAEAAAKVAAEKVEADRVAAVAEKASIEKAAAAQARTLTLAAQSSYASGTSNASGSSTVPAPSGTAVASSAIGAALVASAYGQIGTNQDCTAMVEKALRSVGKSVGDIAPNDFYRYGTVVTNPQPGDLMIQPGHVAIYVGNGMAISGGFNGGHTELHPASYIAGSTFVRVS